MKLFAFLLALLLSCSFLLAAPPTGDGVSFDGNSGFRVEAKDINLNPKAFSVAVWVRVVKTDTTQYLVALGSPANDMTLYLHRGGIRMIVEADPATPGGQGITYDVAVAPLPEPGTWTHYLGTYDGETISIYKNGIKQAFIKAPCKRNAFNTPLFIGASAERGRGLAGSLDDVRLWNRSLTDAEVAKVFNGETVTNGLIAAWNVAGKKDTQWTNAVAGGPTAVVFKPGVSAQSSPSYPSLNNQKIDGYKGIWFTLGQFSEYGDKYSGGLGTYTTNHTPLAIYAPEVQKTFFVYGGSIEDRRSNTYPQREGRSHGDYLLCMAGYFDHTTQTVSKPTVVLDKGGIHDPHDNPTIAIDHDGYIWIFPAGRARSRPGFIFKSRQPYSVDAFDKILEDEICYPQPYFVKDQGFLLLFTKYTGNRLLYYSTSPDGNKWTEHQQLVAIKRPEDQNGGHYQVSARFGDKIVFFCNWHPNGNVDKRTNLYYLQTTDFGKTWTKVDGTPLTVPVTEVNGEAQIREFFSKGQNVYLHDVAFDENGNPMILYLYGNRHEPGPVNGLKQWAVTYWDGKEWINRDITTSDHNYDAGSIWATENKWVVIGPTENSPQPWGGGGEIVIWESSDKGKTWKRTKQITHNSPRNHNYVRKVVNGVDPFMYFWADGNPDQPSISLMYFGDSQGNVWQLPYTMTEDSQKPQKGQSQK